jgi:hypothetical protein
MRLQAQIWFNNQNQQTKTSNQSITHQKVSKYLGIDCSVLMGANIAMDIGKEEVGDLKGGAPFPGWGVCYMRLVEKRFVWGGGCFVGPKS